jgi:Sulfotransferase family
MLISKMGRPGEAASDGRALAPAPFVVGAPRSGTTLLRLMLDAHPDLAIPAETNFIPRVAEECAAASDSAEAFCTALVSLDRWGDFRVDGQRLRERVARISPFDVAEAFRAFYQLCAERFDKPRWGDKTPTYLLEMTKIQAILPEARFVHIVRDGRDCAVSTKDLWFGPEGGAHAGFWWYSMMNEARMQATQLDHYLEVRYEDLVADAEPVLRQVCEFADLPWDPAVLRYYERSETRLQDENRPMLRTDGEGGVIQGSERLKIHARTKEAPRSDRIGRWRIEMSPADQEAFAAIAGEALEEFGYAVETDGELVDVSP